MSDRVLEALPNPELIIQAVNLVHLAAILIQLVDNGIHFIALELSKSLSKELINFPINFLVLFINLVLPSCIR